MDPSPIIRTLLGYWSAQVLAAAMCEDLFAALERSPCTAMRSAQRRGLTNIALVGALMEALVELGFVKGSSEGYAPALVTRHFLTGAPGVPDLRRIGGVFIGMQAPLVSSIGRALRGEYPPHGERLTSTEVSIGMEALSLPVADALAGQLVGRPISTVVDLGGGSGIFSRHLAGVLPTAYFLQVDTNSANEFARITAANEGLSNRFEAVEADIREFARAMPSADLILCSHVLHYFDANGIQDLIQSCVRALNPHGTLVVIEFTQKPGQTRGLFRALFEVFLKAHSPTAGIPSMSLLRDCAECAHLGVPRIVSLEPRPSNIFIWNRSYV